MLVIDWLTQEVPLALLTAGFDVFSANLAAGTVSQYRIAFPSAGTSSAGDWVEVLPPQRDGDPPLVMRRLGAMPRHVDIVALYRPAAEHARIAQRAVDLGARTVWVQLGTFADDARRIVAAAFIAVIDNTSIDDAIHSLVALA